MKTLKVLSALLAYPTEDLIKASNMLNDILQSEAWVPEKDRDAIKRLTTYIQNSDMLFLQEEYVDLFDRTPSLSLHMFEHIHGDSKDRGQAMVDLAELYKEAELEMQGNETPDYLPMFLEYLSLLPVDEATLCLGEVVNVIAAIESRLEQRKTPYASVFNALVSLANTKPSEVAVKKAMDESDGEALSNMELDKEWQEQFAFDNKQGGGCSIHTKSNDKVSVVIEENN